MKSSAAEAGATNWRSATEVLEVQRPALVRYARRYSLCADDADDAFQRAAELLLTKAPPMSDREIVRWMHTVVRNEAFTLRRQRGRMLSAAGATDPGRDSGDWIDALPSERVGPAEATERAESVAQAREALRRIKPDERTALGLLGEGRSYSEIQEITGWSYTKVNRCLAEGRKRFRELLSRAESGIRCAELSGRLSRFADREASLDEQAEVEAHLEACVGCRATLATYRSAPRAAAALLPALPIPGTGTGSLSSRLQEVFVSIQSRISGRSQVADTVLAQAATGTGPRGGGMAALAKVAVICAGAGGGAAACVATGVVPTPLIAERDPTPAAMVKPAPEAAEPAVEAEPEPPAASDAYAEPEPVPAPTPEPPPEPAPEPEPEPAAPPPSPVDQEFSPEAAGTPIPVPQSSSGSGSSAPATTSAPASSTGSGGGPAPAPAPAPATRPPIGGGGEFGP